MLRGVCEVFFIEKGQIESVPEGFEPEQHKTDKVTLDFAYIMFVGLQIGLSKTEIGRMRYGTWSRLCKEYQHQWNMRIKGMTYVENEEQSILDLHPD